MKSSYWRPFAGFLLLTIGVLALLQSFNIVPFTDNLLMGFFTGLFLVTGLAFLFSLIRNPSAWWAIIPGIILLDLAVVMGLAMLAPGLIDKIGGAIFLTGISLAFWLVYLSSFKRWWAIIPGGVLATLALIAGLENVLGWDSGALVLLGLAVTFALLAILPTGMGVMKWPWIPAGVLFVVAMGVSMATTSLVAYVWPAALIISGVYLLVRSRNK
jgi:hypothetical protein